MKTDTEASTGVERPPDSASADQEGQDRAEEIELPRWRIYLTTVALGLMGLLAAFDSSMLGRWTLCSRPPEAISSANTGRSCSPRNHD